MAWKIGMLFMMLEQLLPPSALQAAALGLFIHQMAGFDVEKAQELFSIPAGYQPVAAMPPKAACLLRLALGYQGDSQTLSERLQQREVAPRTRKVLEKFVFSGSWQQTSPLVASAELSNLEQSGS